MSKNDLFVFLSITKPTWCIPTDIVVMAQLFMIDGKEYIGHEEMATRCALKDDKAVVRALKRLEAAGWITKGDGTYGVEITKMPMKEGK